MKRHQPGEPFPTFRKWYSTDEIANGANGINGTNGTNGIDGTNGADGADGSNGADGTDGADGADGTDGADGADGIDGTDGIDGIDGADGINGTDGIDGIDGADGADGIDGIDGTSFDPNLPRLSMFFDSFSSTVAGNVLNTYFFSRGIFTITEAKGFSIDASNMITYRGTSHARVKVMYTVTPWSSVDNQNTWMLFIKNPTADSFGPQTPANFPVGYVPGSVIKGLARNLGTLLASYTGIFTVAMNTNDTLRLYQANVTAGNSHNLRDARVCIETVEYISTSD